MSVQKTIVDVLFDGMKSLYEECANVKEYMKELSVPSNELNSFQRKSSELDDCMSLIRVHQELKNSRLQEIDFYSKFKKHFYKDKANKEVRFIVINGLENEEDELDDNELLKRYIIADNKDIEEKPDKDIEEEKRKQFIIKNCLPVMELVPIQFASNARKYMPPGTIVTVTLRKTAKRNFITVSNLGPRSEQDEMNTILDEGGRGKNTSAVRGMGLGLKQVKEIMNMHKEWLDTAFSVSYSEENFNLENVPYSMFTVKFSFLNGENEQKINTEFLQWNESLWSNDMPIVIVHNMFTVAYDLRKLCEDKLMSLKLSEDNDKDEWKWNLAKLIMAIRRFDDILRQYLYKEYLNSDDELLDDIMGNECSVSLHKVVDRTFKNLVDTFYSHKNIKYDIQVNQPLKSIKAHSCFYSFISGVFSLLLDSAPKNSFFEITYDGERNDNHITIICEDCDIRSIFNEKAETSELIQNRIAMYMEMISEWNGAFVIRDHALKIMF